jgi:predicted DCC family thiol-disulfide oxidoreductase YuxK
MPQVTVWFDGQCPLCRREIAVMRRLDRRGAIAFVDVGGVDVAGVDGSGAAILCPIDPATLLARFHAQEDGRMLSGAAAFAAMWRAIPLLRPLGMMARNRVILGVLERLYLVFLKVRPRLQRALVRWEGEAT